METITTLFGRQDDLHKKILLVAIAIIGLMILFPPKVIVNKNPLLGQSVSQSAGYQFIFSDPAAQQKADMKIVLGDHVDEVISSGIEWGKLLIQLVVVVAVAAAALHFLTTSQPRRMGGSSA